MEDFELYMDGEEERERGWTCFIGVHQDKEVIDGGEVLLWLKKRESNGCDELLCEGQERNDYFN